MATARIAALVVALAATFPAVAADEKQPNVITWEQTADHIGEEVTVEGRVLGVHCSPLSCLLALNLTRAAAEQSAAKKSAVKPRAAREKAANEML